MGPPTSIWRFKARLSRSLRDRLSAWEAELRTAISDQMTERLEIMADAPETPHQVHPRTAPWAWEEVVRQQLAGNVHLNHGSQWAGRLTREAEGRALRWAAAGITQIAHLMICTEAGGPWRLMTPEEALEVYGGESGQRIALAEVSSLTDALPDAWKVTLATAQERHCRSIDTPQWRAPQEGDVLRTGRGTMLLVTRTPTLVSRGRVRHLEWQGCTARLSQAGQEEEVATAALRGMQHTKVRYRPLPVVDEAKLDELEADPLSPDAQKQIEAMHLRMEAIVPGGGPGGEDAEQLGYVRPSTVRMARLVALGNATTSDLTNLAAARDWAPPRTIDAREAGAHYYQWLKHMRPNTQRLVVARWVRDTQVEWLPGQARNVYLRRLHSADFMGPQRCSGGWEFCARCRAQRGGLSQCAEAQHESAVHAHEQCPATGGTAEIMRIVTRCWEEATGEVLRANGPTALFGDRRYGRTEEDAQQYKHLEEPWRALHAAVVITLDVARRDSRPPAYTKRKLHKAPLDEGHQPVPWSTARIMSRVCKELDKIARRRADQLQQVRKSCNSNESAYVDFHKDWVLTGLAKVRGGRICTLILANWRNPRPTDPRRALLVFATDGSGQGGQAGWGLTSVRTTQGSMQVDIDAEFNLGAAVREECGRVISR